MAIDDELLMAYADGELDEVSRARIERAIAEDPALRGRLEQQQRLRATLAAHYGPAAQEPVPERLRAMLESNVVRLAAPKPRPLWQSVAALAATLVLGLALGRAVLTPAGPVGMENGTLVARGPLADALDGQLASTQPADAATRIGISFAATDGRLCRTFESAGVSGLACRNESRWQLMMAAVATNGPRGDYRQAGSDAQVLAAAQEMMAGAAFDAAAERRARDSGWRGRGGSR
jgi:putative zinc finger protein